MGVDFEVPLGVWSGLGCGGVLVVLLVKLSFLELWRVLADV
jgi:hypothetical protein